MSSLWFSTWLKQQVHRRDPIGDLARDVAEDTCLGPYRSSEVLRDHMDSHNAIPEAMQALDEAEAEYLASRCRVELQDALGRWVRCKRPSTGTSTLCWQHADIAGREDIDEPPINGYGRRLIR